MKHSQPKNQANKEWPMTAGELQRARYELVGQGKCPRCRGQVFMVRTPVGSKFVLSVDPMPLLTVEISYRPHSGECTRNGKEVA